MTISLPMLLEFLRDFSPEYDPSMPMIHNIEGLFFLDSSNISEIKFIENCIYLCENKLIKHIKNVPENILFFCIGDESDKIMAHKPHTVYFHNAISLNHIVNRYHSLITQFIQWDRDFHQEMIHNCTLDTLLDLGNRWITHPIMIFDPSFNLVCVSKYHKEEIVDKNDATALGYTPPEFMTLIQQKNLLSQVQNSVCSIIKPGISGELHGKKTYNIYRCYKDGDKIVGYSTIFCGTQYPSQSYLDVCEKFSQNLDMYFRITHKNSQTTSYMYEYLLSSLMREYQNPDSRWLSDRLQYIKIPKTGVFALIHFDFYRDQKFNGYACSLLQKYFPSLNIFLHENKVYMLIAMESSTTFDQMKTNLLSIIKQTNLHFGRSHPWQCYISNPFITLSDIYYAYKQCEELKEIITSKEHQSSQTYFYENYIAHHCFSYLSKQYDLKFLIWPVFWEIKKYDEEHHTLFIDTIKQYLNYDCNLTRTAKEMHMHRNSVENRLKKIESLFHLDLSNFHTLHMFYWTFNLIDYIG